MHILILGGTSFYGKRLAQQLISAGHQLTLFIRGSKEKVEKELLDAGATIIHGDRTEYAKFSSYFTDGIVYDVIVDNTARSAIDVSCALDTLGSRTRHYILCSSVAVYADWERSAPYREEEVDLDYISIAADDDTDKRKFLANFANNKRAAEKALLARASTIPYTIIRPATIEGPDDPVERTWYWTQRLLQGVPVIVPVTAVSQHVYVEDVARFVFEVATHAPRNRAYNVVGDDILQLEDYIKMIFASLPIHGFERRALSIIPVERPLVLKKAQSFPLFFEVALRLDNSAAKVDYGFTPTSISEWLPKTVAWEIEHCKIPDGSSELYEKELQPFLGTAGPSATTTLKLEGSS